MARHPLKIPLSWVLSVWPFQVGPEMARLHCPLVLVSDHFNVLYTAELSIGV